MTVSPLYPQDIGEKGLDTGTKQEGDERASIEKGEERPRSEQDIINPSGEVYSPYPSNFMIPKGVCEKSEPIMIIEDK